jgi:Lipocalin-like domain
MNRSIGKVAGVLLVVTVLFVGTLFGASGVWAKEKGTTLAKQIQGTWILVSMYVEQDGKKIEPFGSKPRGSIILTPDSRFSIIFMKESLPKFTANSRVKGTAEENQAVVQGSFAYYGTYAVANEKEQTVNLHIEGSTFPNWDGQDQKRVMTVKGDEMNVTNPTSAIGGVTYFTLKRVK